MNDELGNLINDDIPPYLKSAINNYSSEVFDDITIQNQKQLENIMVKLNKKKLYLIDELRNKGIFIPITDGFKDTIDKWSFDGKPIFRLKSEVIRAYKHALFQPFINLKVKHYEYRDEEYSYSIKVEIQDIKELYEYPNNIDYEFHFDTEYVYVFLKLTDDTYLLNSILLVHISHDEYNNILFNLRKKYSESTLFDLDLFINEVRKYFVICLKEILEKVEKEELDHNIIYDYFKPNSILKIGGLL